MRTAPQSAEDHAQTALFLSSAASSTIALGGETNIERAKALLQQGVEALDRSLAEIDRVRKGPNGSKTAGADKTSSL